MKHGITIGISDKDESIFVVDAHGRFQRQTASLEQALLWAQEHLSEPRWINVTKECRPQKVFDIRYVIDSDSPRHQTERIGLVWCNPNRSGNPAAVHVKAPYFKVEDGEIYMNSEVYLKELRLAKRSGRISVRREDREKTNG